MERVAARTFGMFVPLSTYDTSNQFQTLRDVYAAEMHLEFLWDRYIQPRILGPLLSRLDDMMINIVVSFGAKNFGMTWRRYWEERKLADRKERDELETKYDELYNLENFFSANEADNVHYDQKSKDEMGQYYQEKAGEVPFERLERAAAQIDDVLQAEIDNYDVESGESLKRDFSNLQKSFEKDPKAFINSIDTESSVSDRAQDMLDTMDFDKIQVQVDSHVEINLEDYTEYGDKKIKPDNIKDESTYQREREQKLADWSEQDDNPYVYDSTDDFAHAMTEAWVHAQGFESVDDYLKHQKDQRDADLKQKQEIRALKVAKINRHRKTQGLPPIEESQIPLISDGELEEWRKKKM